MKALLIAASLVCGSATVCLAEPPTAEQAAMEVISSKLAELNETNEMMVASRDAATTKELMDKGLQIVSEIRDVLALSSYIRVSGFTVGIPAGISVDFEFVKEN